MPTAMHLNVGPGLLPDFMTGAFVHCILAWPTDRDILPFHRVSRELIAEVVRLTLGIDAATIDKCRSEWPQQDWDQIEHLAKSKSRKAVGHLQKRLNQRMAAARMGIGLAHQELFGRPAVLPSTISALSIDQLSVLVRSDTHISDSENIEKFVWRASLPIIHLAMAVQLMLTGRFNDRTEIGCNLQDFEFYRETIKLASTLEVLVLAHPKFNIGPDRLTRVRWYE